MFLRIGNEEFTFDGESIKTKTTNDTDWTVKQTIQSYLQDEEISFYKNTEELTEEELEYLHTHNNNFYEYELEQRVCFKFPCQYKAFRVLNSKGEVEDFGEKDNAINRIAYFFEQIEFMRRIEDGTLEDVEFKYDGQKRHIKKALNTCFDRETADIVFSKLYNIPDETFHFYEELLSWEEEKR